jgi:hypothetical protein
MALQRKVAILLVALSIAAVAAANAGATNAKLNMTSLGNNRYNLTADVFNTGYYPYGVDVAFRLWGDDEWYDDLLYSVPGTTFGNGWTGHIVRSFTVSGGTLDEDWGSDEIYVDARLYDHHTGKLILTLQTNRLYGSWS